MPLAGRLPYVGYIGFLALRNQDHALTALLGFFGSDQLFFPLLGADIARTPVNREPFLHRAIKILHIAEPGGRWIGQREFCNVGMEGSILRLEVVRGQVAQETLIRGLDTGIIRIVFERHTHAFVAPETGIHIVQEQTVPCSTIRRVNFLLQCTDSLEEELLPLRITKIHIHKSLAAVRIFHHLIVHVAQEPVWMLVPDPAKVTDLIRDLIAPWLCGTRTGIVDRGRNDVL